MSEYLSLFKNKTAESLFFEKYDLFLKLWPIPYETDFIETEYGQTHVIKCGNKKGPVVVLMHGMGGTAAMWTPNIKELSKKYYIIAIDILGDLNKSKVKKPFNNNKEAAEWLISVIDNLKIDKFSIMGVSYGSFLSMNLSIHKQQRIENLIIISPTVSITKIQMKFWFWVIKIIFSPFNSTNLNFLKWLNANKPLVLNDFTELQILGMKYRNPKIKALIHLFNDEELLQIKIPVLLLIGSKEVVTKIDEVKKRSEKLFKNLTFQIIDDAGHTLSYEKSEIINPIILDFLNDSYTKKALHTTERNQN